MRSTAHPVLALIVMGFMAIAFVALAAHALYLDEEFDESTHRSQATIDRNWSTYGSKGGVHYHARYHFLDDKGLVWTDSSEVAAATFRRLYTGEVVPVKYLESNAGQSRIDWPDEDRWHWHQDEILACVGLFVGGMGVLILISKRR